MCYVEVYKWKIYLRRSYRLVLMGREELRH